MKKITTIYPSNLKNIYKKIQAEHNKIS